MKLTPKQIELYKLIKGTNSLLAEGGGRSGKTMAIIRYIFIRALKFPKTDHLIIRFRFAHAKQSICYQTIPKLQELENLNFTKFLNKTDWFYKLPNGSRIWITGADEKERVDKILGNEYSTIFFNECSQISYDTVETVSTRLNPPQGVKGKRFFDHNPPSVSHWTYKIFHNRKLPDGRDVPENDFKWIKMNPADNPHVSAEYLASTDADCRLAIEYIKSIRRELTKGTQELINQSLKILAYMRFTQPPQVSVQWGNLSLLSETQKAQVMGGYASAICQLLGSGAVTKEGAFYFTKELYPEYPAEDAKHMFDGFNDTLVDFTSKAGGQPAFDSMDY